MSRKFCINCGKIVDSDYEHCIFCGENPDMEDPDFYDTLDRRTVRFFCPSCKHENIIGNLECYNCGEDFTNLDIRRSISETSISQKLKERDEFSKEYFKTVSVDHESSRRIPLFFFIIPTIIIVIIASAIAIWFLYWEVILR
jgi:uncharacterized membrane protein YvbJ